MNDEDDGDTLPDVGAAVNEVSQAAGVLAEKAPALLDVINELLLVFSRQLK